jgi:hypothetical protein|tara:strand:- start:244 stop:630 length:387 start_codon:yes stop_codon:yes gene_type:complete
MNKKWVLRSKFQQDRCVEYISTLDLEDPQLLEVMVKPYKKNRSLEQNDMFHAWCGTIADKTGHSKGEVKDILLESVFGSEEYLNLQGEKRSRLRSSSDLSRSEMSELIERTTQLGIELGAEVPEVTHG